MENIFFTIQLYPCFFFFLYWYWHVLPQIYLWIATPNILLGPFLLYSYYLSNIFQLHLINRLHPRHLIYIIFLYFISFNTFYLNRIQIYIHLEFIILNYNLERFTIIIIIIIITKNINLIWKIKLKTIKTLTKKKRNQNKMG